MYKPPTYEEWLKHKKDQWWTLNRSMHWVRFVKRICQRCGKTYVCHDCTIGYFLCWSVTDWRDKKSCYCPLCQIEILKSVS